MIFWVRSKALAPAASIYVTSVLLNAVDNILRLLSPTDIHRKEPVSSRNYLKATPPGTHVRRRFLAGSSTLLI
jgi:hypothetical protein